MEPEMLSAIVSIGLLQPRVPIELSIDAMRQLGVDATVDVICKHKVTRLARWRLSKAAAERPMDADFVRSVSSAVGARRSVLDRRFRSAGGTLTALSTALPDTPVRLMKGLAAQRWYPEESLRDVGDADLWTPDLESGWKVVGALRSLGYIYEAGELPWVKGDLRGNLFGQMRLLGPDEESISVDVHTGPYSIRYCGLLHFRKSMSSAPWQPLALEDNLCAVIGNIAGDCFIDGKTVNDCIVTLTGGLDTEYVRSRIEEADLSGFMAALFEVVGQLSDLTPEQAATLDRLGRDLEPEGIGLSQAPDPELRIELVAAHAEKAGLRLTDDQDLAGEISTHARSAYSNGTRYRLMRDSPTRGQLPELKPWTCVRLAPQELLRAAFRRSRGESYLIERRFQLSESLEVLRGPSGDLVRFDEDVFVPTVDYSFPVGLVEGQVTERPT
ncbi:hypothetical protein ACQP26_19655 [Micromonospora sp. CA-248089]|uniref:hypothetical protein n=1 Tax=Micromonospora sp. CA-248089 TaxID=3239960 RepID=UPI003D8ED49A